MAQRQCDHCGNSYEYNRAHSHFCSDACRQWFYRQNKKEAKPGKSADPTGEHFKAALVAIDGLMEADMSDIARHASEYRKLIDGIDNLFAKVQREGQKQRIT